MWAHLHELRWVRTANVAAMVLLLVGVSVRLNGAQRQQIPRSALAHGEVTAEYGNGPRYAPPRKGPVTTERSGALIVVLRERHSPHAIRRGGALLVSTEHDQQGRPDERPQESPLTPAPVLTRTSGYAGSSLTTRAGTPAARTLSGTS